MKELCYLRIICDAIKAHLVWKYNRIESGSGKITAAFVDKKNRKRYDEMV